MLKAVCGVLPSYVWSSAYALSPCVLFLFTVRVCTHISIGACRSSFHADGARMMVLFYDKNSPVMQKSACNDDAKLFDDNNEIFAF